MTVSRRSPRRSYWLLRNRPGGSTVSRIGPRYTAVASAVRQTLCLPVGIGGLSSGLPVGIGGLLGLILVVLDRVAGVWARRIPLLLSLAETQRRAVASRNRRERIVLASAAQLRRSAARPLTAISLVKGTGAACFAAGLHGWRRLAIPVGTRPGIIITRNRHSAGARCSVRPRPYYGFRG